MKISSTESFRRKRIDIFSNSKKGSTSLLTLETSESNRGLIGAIEDEFEFHEYVDLVVLNRPIGAANEFRLGERVSIGLDFETLDQKFDYRLNRCWALSPTYDGNLFAQFYFFAEFYFFFAEF